MKIFSQNTGWAVGVTVTCALLSAGSLEAKKDKDKGNDKGGHSEKGKGKDKENKGKDKDDRVDRGGKDDDKARKEMRKDLEKDRKDFEKDVKEARKDSEKRDKEIAEWREKRFRDNDREGLVRYFSRYKDREHGLPPGLAKNLRRGKPLPPGWRDKVSRGYVIEDDYQDYFYPVSYDLFPDLEVVPETRLYRYGDRIVRVYEPRREVIDLIIVPTIRFD